ncbi:hypothetical protein CVT24_007862 [Panaeolus cyanescens]|uniref:Peptidase M20 dimerisation domain-containing protein n=1 Tax=Panaeolus cyanescens TaxID=181874 RepID=A0A409VCH7_9AGAR|nr:hypothetical protein CVT24_007862 [Panaeolus cyanescens]
MYNSEEFAGCFSGLFGRKTRIRRNNFGSSGIVTSSKDEPPAENTPFSERSDAKEHKIDCFNPCCDFSYASTDSWWSHDDALPAYTPGIVNPRTDDVSTTIDTTLDSLSSQLRDLSLKIHSHPELNFNERYAHDLLTDFMSRQGFKVTRHYLGLDTAWRAEYARGKGGRVIGINSEMDALKGIGHACGHNLIAISGVGVAIALKAALDTQTHASGKIILLGTPAEENGGGKIILLEKGAYGEMDVCLMQVSPRTRTRTLYQRGFYDRNAIHRGGIFRSAHAGAAPWEGTNALDAAFLAYSSVSVLRQQIKPDHRVHGVVEGKDWQANVIPDYAKMRWLARAPTSKDLAALVERVQNCLRAGAVATGCTMEMKVEPPYFDLHQNPALSASFVIILQYILRGIHSSIFITTLAGQCFADVVGSRYGVVTTTNGSTASTDFGNISYALPSLHPLFAIPTEPNGGNHTAAFAKAAKTEAAHEATMIVTKALALTGYRVLSDSDFFHKVRTTFEGKH